MKLSNENRLSIVHPNLCQEWNYNKNELMPEKVSSGSHEKVWWKCKNGHEWRSSINLRTNKKSGCPYCHNKKIDKYNSLAVINPNLSEEWNCEKNTVDPYGVFPNSNKKAWWKCKKGHEWNATIASRNRGSGCPYCSGHKVSENNCLALLYPHLIKEWNYKKNKSLSPYSVSDGSKIKVWWKCKNRHEWLSSIKNRTNGYNCPYCSGLVKLKDGTLCDSMIDAFFYLKFRKQKVIFIYNKKYPKNKNKKLGSKGLSRYDFYFPGSNKYIEVTSYSKNEKWWKNYIKKITKKKNYVLNVLNAKFKFIQKKLNCKERKFIVENSSNFV